MDPQRLWILIGTSLGVGAGIVGACIGWLRSVGRLTRRIKVMAAALTLFFAIGLTVVALSVDAAWGIRLLLVLPPISLGYWFVRQVADIRAGGRSGHEAGRSDRKER